MIDNASIHYVDNVSQLVSRNGAIIWFLPAYSPDFMPLGKFSKVKYFLGKMEPFMIAQKTLHR